MGRVAIVTDSTAYFEPGTDEDLDITVVPLNIHVGDETLRDGVDISHEAFFHQMERNESVVRVSPPSARQFQDLYSEIHARTDRILSVHVSGQLSPTLVNARQGAENLLGRCEIVVVDSLTTSLGLGILATAAARAAQRDAGLDEVVRLVRGMIPHLYLVLYANDLDYLERSHHLSKPQAILGSIFNIKPLLFMEDGEVTALEKVRTHERAIEKLTEFMAEFSDVEQAAILQCQPAPTAETRVLLERLQPLFPDLAFPVIQYGPALATHIGSSSMGVVVYESEE
jgi:DegV family protein with EDD domain